MSEAEGKPQSAGLDPDPYARREALCRRLAEQGISVQIPARGEWQPPEVLLPFSADELSESVIRMRRGDL
jgi:hypothetical protein